PLFFFCAPSAPPAFSSLSLHDALPISWSSGPWLTVSGTLAATLPTLACMVPEPACFATNGIEAPEAAAGLPRLLGETVLVAGWSDRKSTRMHSSHLGISYPVFCLKKKNKRNPRLLLPQRPHRHADLGRHTPQAA